VVGPRRGVIVGGHTDTSKIGSRCLRAAVARGLAVYHAARAGTIRPPTADQIAKIKTLAGQVDQLTQQSVAASQAVVATGNVLDLLAKSGLG